MTLPRTPVMICLLCSSLLSPATQAYLIQVPNQDSHKTSLSLALAPFPTQETPSFIQEPQTAPDFFRNLNRPLSSQFVRLPSNQFVRLPSNLGLTNEFNEMSSRHSVINTDQSKRFNAPEPSAWIMMSLGLFGLVLARRKKRD